MKKLQNESFKCYRKDVIVRSDSSDNDDDEADDDDTDDATDSSGSETATSENEDEDEDDEEEEEEEEEDRSRMSGSQFSSLPITTSLESSSKLHGANCVGRGGAVVLDKAGRRRKDDSDDYHALGAGGEYAKPG